jgi:hypothetical protein
VTGSIRPLRRLPLYVAGTLALLSSAMLALPDALAAPKECRGAARRLGGCIAAGINQPPVISGTPSSLATVGSSYAFVPAAADPEGATLRFSIVNKPSWAAFSTSTGRLSGTPAAADVGLHVDIVIKVSDGKLEAQLGPFEIEVGTGNSAPTIAGTPATAAREGQPYEFRPEATDADGDALGFSIANRPSWAAFDAQTGRLSGTPGTGTAGIYENVTIRVSDSRLTATLPAFTITVEQISLGSVTLSWTPPTQREDGSPLVDLAGYVVRYGTAPGSYPNQLQIPNAGSTTCVVENLPAGTYYFVVIAYDSAGLQSRPSAEVSTNVS